MKINVPSHGEKINLSPIPQRDVPLSRFCAMPTKGRADWASSPSTSAELRNLLAFAREREIPVTYLGGGTNTIISDGGIRGLVIVTTNLNRHHASGELFCAQGGLSLNRAIDLAIEGGLAGLELLGGIPGTVGGAIWGNSGSGDTLISDYLYFVDYMDRKGDFHRLQTKAEDFSYRHSPFMEMGDVCIYEAGFRLRPTRQSAELRLAKERAKEIRRQNHQYEKPSCGCAFKNPPGLSAGALIDKAGLKGLEVGGAAVSVHHANFIVDKGGATAEDVHRLAEKIRSIVAVRYGIRLEYEIRFLGEFQR